MAARSIQSAYSGRVQPCSRTSVRWTAGSMSTKVAATARSVVRSRSQPADCREAGHEEFCAPEPVTFGHGVHIGGFRVGVRSHDEYVGQGRRPLLQLGDELCPTGHERAGIGQLFHLRDDLPFGQRDRFVVTHQRPVQRELQECRLATDRGEHRLAAHPGSGGHGVDGRA